MKRCSMAAAAAVFLLVAYQDPSMASAPVAEPVPAIRASIDLRPTPRDEAQASSSRDSNAHPSAEPDDISKLIVSPIVTTAVSILTAAAICMATGLCFFPM